MGEKKKFHYVKYGGELGINYMTQNIQQSLLCGRIIRQWHSTAEYLSPVNGHRSNVINSLTGTLKWRW